MIRGSFPNGVRALFTFDPILADMFNRLRAVEAAFSSSQVESRYPRLPPLPTTR